MTQSDLDKDSDSVAAHPDDRTDSHHSPSVTRRYFSNTSTFQSVDRYTVAALTGIGLAAGIAGITMPGSREILFALAGTGLFGATLTYTLASNRVLSAEVSEGIYAATAANQEAIIEEYDLRHEQIYVPTDGQEHAHLYVSPPGKTEIPAEATGAIGPTERGFVLTAIGDELLHTVDNALVGDLAETPGPLAVQLSEGLVDALELVRHANPAIGDDHVTVTVSESVIGDVDRLDHPIVSFLGVGFAVGLDREVAVDVEAGDRESVWIITCRWE